MSAPALSLRRRTLVWFLLGLSFGCNLAVLFLPFMDLRLGLSSEPYTLFSSIRMLWEAKLYVLVVLVVGFSVLFPFAKLAMLTAVCSAPRGNVSARRRRGLAFVERLGKWSMLDVFLVCLILTLTSNQLLVGASPLVGIPLFVFAILLSMTAGEILATALHSVEKEKTPATPRPTWRTGGWLVLSGLALLGTLGAPFLQISDWKLSDTEYSIASVIPALWQQESYISAVILGVFLIAFPLLGWLVSLRLWQRIRRGKSGENIRRRLRFLRRWSMLDVFGLALAIFLIEGDYLMSTEVRLGGLCLLALLFLQQAFQLALEKSPRPAAEKIDHKTAPQIYTD